MHEHLRPDQLSLRFLSRRARRAAYKNAQARKQAYDSTVIYEGNYASQNTQRAMSGLWGVGGLCPWGSILDGTTPGMCWYDDFQGLYTASSQASGALGNYKAYTSVTLSKPTSINSVIVPGGALYFPQTTSTTSAMGQSSGQYTLTGLASTSGKLWFECSIAVPVITTASAGFFVGLATVEAMTLSTTHPMAVSGTAIDSTSTSMGWVGFNLPSSGLGQIKTVYADGSVTAFTAVGATDCNVMVPYTFTRLGMVYDPSQTGTSSTYPSTCAIQFWQDGNMLPNGITNTTLVVTTNISVKDFGLFITPVCGATTSAGTYLQWWRVAQLFPN